MILPSFIIHQRKFGCRVTVLLQSAALHILEIAPTVADGRQADQLRKNSVEMVDVGVADDGGNLRCTVIGRNEQVLRLADAAADHIMNRRHAGHVLEDMREMVRRHGERLADVLERELLGEMRADILADAVRASGGRLAASSTSAGSRCETISSE